MGLRAATARRTLPSKVPVPIYGPDSAPIDFSSQHPGPQRCICSPQDMAAD